MYPPNRNSTEPGCKSGIAVELLAEDRRDDDVALRIYRAVRKEKNEDPTSECTFTYILEYNPPTQSPMIYFRPAHQRLALILKVALERKK